MNRENIQKVRDVIAGLKPERFNMSYWAVEERCKDAVSPRSLLRDCGTCGCIGGWTNAVFNQPLSKNGATDSLGLTPQKGRALFYPYVGIGWSKIGPPTAARVLDILLETGEVDWPRAIRETTEAEVSQ